MSTYRIAQPHAARIDRLGRQAWGFPWTEHLAVDNADDKAQLLYLQRTVGLTPAQFCRLRELRHREGDAPTCGRDRRGRFA